VQIRKNYLESGTPEGQRKYIAWYTKLDEVVRYAAGLPGAPEVVDGALCPPSLNGGHKKVGLLASDLWLEDVGTTTSNMAYTLTGTSRNSYFYCCDSMHTCNRCCSILQHLPP
jgi:hypothetical protein